MENSCEEEIEYDSICFNKSCIQADQQLYSSNNYTQGVSHYYHKETCRYLRTDLFKQNYDIPHKLIKKIQSIFYRSLDEEMARRQNQCERVFRKAYKRQAKKVFKMYMNHFTINDCGKIIERLRRKSNLRKDQQTQFLTHLVQRNEEKIEESMNYKLSQLTNQFTYLTEKIFANLRTKIAEIFFQKFNQIPIKQEERESSVSEYKVYKVPQIRQFKSEQKQSMMQYNVKEQQKQNSASPIQECKTSPRIKTKKRRMRGKKNAYLDVSNIISKQRSKRGEKVNYLNYHQFGINAKVNQFETAFIINAANDIKQLKNQKIVLQFNVLIINFKIGSAFFIEAIKKFRPKKIIINAEITNFKENLFAYLPEAVLANLIAFQQHWDYDQFINIYANCTYVPKIRTNLSAQKVMITAEMWRNLINLSNVWIGNLSDINELKKSHISLQKMKCLKIQPSSCHSKINFKEIRSMFSRVKSLQTLILKNLVFDRDLIELFIDLTRNNPGIKCLVLMSIDDITQECIQRIRSLSLARLIIHVEQTLRNCYFNPILKMSTLECLSLRRVRFDDFVFQNPSQSGRAQLKNLHYLNLSNSQLSYDDILRCIQSTNIKGLKYLNLQRNELNQSFAFTLRELVSLTELNLNDTSLNLTNFLRHFDKPLRALNKLSLLGYLDINDNDFLEIAHVLTDDNLQQIFRIFPSLKHLNLSSLESIPKARYFCPFIITILADGAEVPNSKPV